MVNDFPTRVMQYSTANTTSSASQGSDSKGDSGGNIAWDISTGQEVFLNTSVFHLRNHLIQRLWILLDNQSMVDIFSNPNLLTSI